MLDILNAVIIIIILEEKGKPLEVVKITIL